IAVQGGIAAGATRGNVGIKFALDVRAGIEGNTGSRGQPSDFGKRRTLSRDTDIELSRGGRGVDSSGYGQRRRSEVEGSALDANHASVKVVAELVVKRDWISELGVLNLRVIDFQRAVGSQNALGGIGLQRSGEDAVVSI